MAPLFLAALKLAPLIAPHIVNKIWGPKGDSVAEQVIEVAKAVTGTKDCDEAVKAVDLNPEHRLAFVKAMNDRDLAFRATDADVEKAYISDVGNARSAHANDKRVFWLGMSILLTFAAVIGAAVVGSYEILTDGLKVSDPGVIAVVFTFIGTLVGYIASQAQSVVNYFFGSSMGSKQKTDELSGAVRALGKK